MYICTHIYIHGHCVLKSLVVATFKTPSQSTVYTTHFSMYTQRGKCIYIHICICIHIYVSVYIYIYKYIYIIM